MDLVPTLDLLDGSSGHSLSLGQGLTSDFSMGTSQASPIHSSHAFGGPFSGMEGVGISPVPSPMSGYASSSMGLESSPLFGAQSSPVHSGLGNVAPSGVNYYSQTPVTGTILSAGYGQGFYQSSGTTMQIGAQAGPMSHLHHVGMTAPGSPSLGVGGSPARIMTRGGKSPATSLSSSPSGPGLEDAVKALGLTMSPSRGSSKAGSRPESRPLSPGQSVLGGGPGYGYGEMGGDAVPSQSQAGQNSEIAQSGISSDFCMFFFW